MLSKPLCVLCVAIRTAFRTLLYLILSQTGLWSIYINTNPQITLEIVTQSNRHFQHERFNLSSSFNAGDKSIRIFAINQISIYSVFSSSLNIGVLYFGFSDEGLFFTFSLVHLLTQPQTHIHNLPLYLSFVFSVISKRKETLTRTEKFTLSYSVWHPCVYKSLTGCWCAWIFAFVPMMFLIRSNDNIIIDRMNFGIDEREKEEETTRWFFLVLLFCSTEPIQTYAVNTNTSPSPSSSSSFQKEI